MTQVGQGFSISRHCGVTPRGLPADSSRREARDMNREETKKAQDAEGCLAVSIRCRNATLGRGGDHQKSAKVLRSVAAACSPANI